MNVFSIVICRVALVWGGNSQTRAFKCIWFTAKKLGLFGDDIPYTSRPFLKLKSSTVNFKPSAYALSLETYTRT